MAARAVGNVHSDEGSAENIKPNKARSKGRIHRWWPRSRLGRADAAEGRRRAREVETA
ncbi:Phage terminase large subunit [Rhodobacter sp. AKP1]|nr:Phage terminase large subunit [Rhodobacter sp. AKP1]